MSLAGQQLLCKRGEVRTVLPDVLVFCSQSCIVTHFRDVLC